MKRLTPKPVDGDMSIYEFCKLTLERVGDAYEAIVRVATEDPMLHGDNVDGLTLWIVSLNSSLNAVRSSFLPAAMRYAELRKAKHLCKRTLLAEIKGEVARIRKFRARVLQLISEDLLRDSLKANFHLHRQLANLSSSRVINCLEKPSIE